MASKAKLRTILNKTKTLFASTHWTQGDFAQWDDEEQKERYCAVGGLRQVTIEDAQAGTVYAAGFEEYREALALLATAIDPEVAEGYVEQMNGDDPSVRIIAVNALEEIVIAWNDDEDRVLNEVLEAFDEAMKPVAR